MKRTLPGITDEDKELMRKLLPLECPYQLKDETINLLCELGNTVTLDKGDVLINVGECDPNFYILIDGLLRCWYWNGDKEETELFSTIPTTFMDYHSTCGDNGSFYCYEACLDSRLIKISKRDYDKLIEESHDFSNWRNNIMQHQLYWMERKKRFAMGNAKERYDSFVKNLPDIMNLVPLRIVASYLRITPQHLSRLRRLP